ncbi:MAG: hypothetical protein CL946_07865 [Ectothiorhodospiraceae bacterium]|nr:hypothetical protein [Ectothiorhodospiraceae bacterium]
MSEVDTLTSAARQDFKEGWGKVLLLLALTAAAILLWDTPIIYPLKLFVVILHELSHGLAAIATGGEIVRIEIYSTLGGICVTRGGIPFVVASSGYIGSIALGGIIFIASQRATLSKGISVVIASTVGILVLLYIRNLFGIIFSAIFTAGMFLLAFKVPQQYRSMTLQLIGTVSCLYALFTIKEDLLTLEHHHSDAQILAGMTGIPAIVWGVLWAAVSLVVFYLVVRNVYGNRLFKRSTTKR